MKTDLKILGKENILMKTMLWNVLLLGILAGLVFDATVRILGYFGDGIAKYPALPAVIFIMIVAVAISIREQRKK